MYKKNSEKGQILLIVVITMIVALTVGLSVASRTVTELRLSKQNEESQRAFNAAEAGIDRVLQQGGTISIPETLGNNSDFIVSSEEYSGAQILLNNGEQVDQDVGADVWLSDYPDFANQIGSRKLTIYWGDNDQVNCSASNPVRPALEVVILHRDITDLSVTKYIYDTCSDPVRISGTLDLSNYGSYTDISGLPGEIFRNKIRNPIIINNGIIMKIIPLYNSTTVAIIAEEVPGYTQSLPSQGSVIESTGTSGETVRRITYYQSYPQLPIEVFPYNIISQ